MKVSLSVAFFLTYLSSCSYWKDASTPERLAPATAAAIFDLPKKAEIELEADIFSHLAFYQSGSYSLPQVILIGLKHNTKTKGTWSDTLESSALYGQSLQNEFILSEFQSIYTRERQPQQFGSFNADTYETLFQNQLELTYTFLDFGQTRNESLKTLYTLYRSGLTHNQTLQLVMRTLIDDYYQLIYEKELLRSYEADVENALLTLESAEEKLRTGMGDVSDVVQARTSALDFQLQVVNQKQVLLSSKLTLLNDMGLPANIDIEPVNFPHEIEKVYQKDYQTLIEMAKRLRPDYLASCSELKAQQYAVKAAKSQYYPTLDGSFEFGKTIGSGGLEDDYDFTATVSLTLPLFQGYYQKNAVKAATAKLLKAESDLQAIALLMTKEVRLYQETIEFSVEAIRYSSDYLASAKEDFRVYLDKYRQGTTTIVDLINAQTNVSDANAKLILAKKDYFSAIADLSYATGSLNVPNKGT